MVEILKRSAGENGEVECGKEIQRIKAKHDITGKLPNECLAHILSFVDDFESLRSASLVNWQMHYITQIRINCIYKSYYQKLAKVPNAAMHIEELDESRMPQWKKCGIMYVLSSVYFNGESINMNCVTQMKNVAAALVGARSALYVSEYAATMLHKTSPCLLRKTIVLCLLLKKIHISGVTLTSIPECIVNLPELEVLHMSHCFIQEIPKGLGKNGKLTHLDLSFNALKSFGEIDLFEKEECTASLKEINLFKNEIQQLPSMKFCKNLEILNCKMNQLIEMPSLEGCRSLKSLNIDNNRLKQLNCDISACKELEILSCNFNVICSFGDSLSGCSSLKIIQAHHNQLFEFEDFPTENLYAIHIDDNLLTTLPDSVGECLSLRILSVENNNLVVLPETLRNCTKISCLRVAMNNLSFFPDIFGNMESLQELSCSCNSLKSFPASFRNCKSLKRLDCHRNELYELPEFD
eukprot:Nk52_evm41s270 gene=Nk52_evmTU41s270